jgi:hypothetical protein
VIIYLTSVDYPLVWGQRQGARPVTAALHGHGSGPVSSGSAQPVARQLDESIAVQRIKYRWSKSGVSASTPQSRNALRLDEGASCTEFASRDPHVPITVLTSDNTDEHWYLTAWHRSITKMAAWRGNRNVNNIATIARASGARKALAVSTAGLREQLFLVIASAELQHCHGDGNARTRWGGSWTSCLQTSHPHHCSCSIQSW